MSANTTTTRVESVKTHFRRIDSGAFPEDLFTSNFQFFFPKYGVGVGAAEFRALAEGLHAVIKRIVHHTDDFVFIERGNLVVVEGTTEGESASGKQWSGGHTPGGRLCSVFAFGKHGLIERMFVCLDPDYLSEDKPRFLGNRGDSQRW
jgi:hypothetical protein